MVRVVPSTEISEFPFVALKVKSLLSISLADSVIVRYESSSIA